MTQNALPRNRRIASEQREAERRKREFHEIEKAVSVAKQKFKKETTEVMLGERDQVSAEVAAAQMLGYRNELIRQQRGSKGVLEDKAASAMAWAAPYM